MIAVLLRVRSDLRARWRSWLGLTLIMGVAGGAVIAAAAGARRTDSSYSRFLRSAAAPDALVFEPNDPSFASIPPDKIASLPQVAATAPLVGYTLTEPNVNLVAAPDDRYGTIVSRHKLLSGRRPVRADEVMVSFVVADNRHLHVGSTLTLHILPRSEDPEAEAPPPLPLRLHVVGVEATPGEFPPQTQTGFKFAWLSSAFVRENIGRFVENHATAVRLNPGAGSLTSFLHATDRLGGDRPTSVYRFRDQAANTQRSIHLQAVALWLLAGLLGVTAALILSQLFFRQALLEGRDHASLHALGMERDQLWAIGMGRAALIGAAAAVVAVVTAIALSPLTPVGIARIAEPRPGVSTDLFVLALGALGTVVLALAAAAYPSWQAARPPSTADEARASGPTALGDALARASVPPPVAAGVRLALDPGRGRSAVPVRSTVIGAALGIGALAGALVFNGSLAHLLGTPRLYGVAWDARITTTGAGGVADVAAAVQRDADVRDLAIGYVGVGLEIRSARVDAIVLQPLAGSFQPRVLEGRLPLGPDEILLGSRTLSQVHARIGDRVPVSILGIPGDVALQVVGRGIMPSTSDAAGLGTGASLSMEAARRLISPAATPPNLDNLVVRFGPGVDAAVARARLADIVSAFGPTFVVVAPDRPNDVVNFGRVQGLPLALAGLMAALATATLAHLLVTSIRRRGRELAIVKTLGFVPRQVRTAVAWQATTLAIAAMAIGVPLGIAAGRWAWIVFARNIGIVPAPEVPILVLLLLVPGTIIVANLVAVVPGELAARLRPGRALRAE
ncbi:MAG TPA: FtsX-like permease family protein [Acidimicrobiales bacterium]|jgi:ABC-type lipoprotein release transport system permease subunit|nr:FtsX-like permease family protein [Acidimicrobiales bacterium]